MSQSRLPEVWLRGPVEGIPPELQPVVHALLQTKEDIGQIVPLLTAELLWFRQGDAAPVGFHLKHIAGSTDRLCTYARGEHLSDIQRKKLAGEYAVGSPVTPEELIADVMTTIDDALIQLRNTPTHELHQPREVGRSMLPSTVLGLLFHAAEHARRHAGQIITTLKILRSREP